MKHTMKLVSWFGNLTLMLMLLGAPAFAQEVDCEKPSQAGCWTLWAANVRYDPSHPLMRNLANPTESDHQYRVQRLGPDLLKEVRNGTVFPAKARSFLIIMWDVNPVDAQHVSSYRVNYSMGKGNVTKASFEEVDPSTIVYDKTSELGTPHRVFRVRTEGAAAAGIQLPWSFRTATTTVLICAEPREDVVYPSGEKDEGHFVTAKTIAWLAQQQSRVDTAPFVARN